MSEIKVPDHGPVTNAIVYGLPESIRRAKFPMSVNPDSLGNILTSNIRSLAKAAPGTGHDQWLTGVIVQFDLTYTVKAWTEFQRYHFADFVSSQSTMHRIARFDLDTAYCEYVDPAIVEQMKCLAKKYNETKDKEDYLRLLYSNPCGMKLTAGITTNYRQLKTMYAQRHDHRLPEWREFCRWIETLPEAELLTGDVNEQKPIDTASVGVPLDKIPGMTTDPSNPTSGKPRLCDLLGVSVGEAFKFATPYRVYDRVYINDDGTMWAETSSGYKHKVGGQSVCWLINHPNVIQKLPPEPRLTEKEISICKLVGARFVSRDTTMTDACLWKNHPVNTDQCGGVKWSSVGDVIACIDRNLFPSVHPGDCLEVPV